MAPVLPDHSLFRNGTNLTIAAIISHLQNGHHIRDVDDLIPRNTTIATSANAVENSLRKLSAGAIVGIVFASLVGFMVLCQCYFACRYPEEFLKSQQEAHETIRRLRERRGNNTKWNTVVTASLPSSPTRSDGEMEQAANNPHNISSSSTDNTRMSYTCIG